MNKNELFQSFHTFMQHDFADMYADADDYEKVGISLCLMPIIQPDLLENIIKQEFGQEGEFPLFGGIRGAQHRGILPTGETWIYFCCGNDIKKRIQFIQTLPNYLTNPEHLLNIETALLGEPFLSGKLSFSTLFRHQFQKEKLVYEQQFSNLSLGGFLHTELQLKDLVLAPSILHGLEEIKHWQLYAQQQQQQQQEERQEAKFIKRIKPGLKVLFYGKSGTGKTQTAAIMGNELNLPVYRIDLSQIVSKYIGETEKNLSRIFNAAERKNWILFFDEGDALFGKRTSVNSSNDRYANQEVAYLLQRIEDYAGIIILSTNLKENIDMAFLRRFQIITEFQLPDKKQRTEIWKKLLSEIKHPKVEITDATLDEIAATELSGGAITNIVNYALLKANYYKSNIQFELLKEGIIRELRKENRLTSLQ